MSFAAFSTTLGYFCQFGIRGMETAAGAPVLPFEDGFAD
jgi:hypothetical protein